MDTETKLDNWVTGKIGFMIQICTVIIGITIVILKQGAETDKLKIQFQHIEEMTTTIQSEINTINTNHLSHIQASMAELAKNVAVLAQRLEDHISE